MFSFDIIKMFVNEDVGIHTGIVNLAFITYKIQNILVK